MHPLIETTTSIRSSFKHFLSNLSLEELNHIPDGFNNDILWNIGHVISVQQMLVIGLGNERWTVDKSIVKEFRKGSKPERSYTDSDRKTLLTQLDSSLVETQSLYEHKKLTSYQTFLTPTGFQIHDFESALAFNLFHEGMHLGTVLAIIKLIKK